MKSAQSEPKPPPRDPDLAGIHAAMLRAAEAARRKAAAIGGNIAVFENGTIMPMEVDRETLALRIPRSEA